MEKQYTLTVRDNTVFGKFEGNVIQQQKVFIKYLPNNDQSIDENYFYDYDEYEIHKKAFNDFDSLSYHCYAIQDLGDLDMYQVSVNNGEYNYMRYIFAEKTEENVPFFQALKRIKYTAYRAYHFDDNQSFWTQKDSALYVNTSGKSHFNEKTGMYEIDGNVLSLTEAAEYGFFDVMTPAINIPSFTEMDELSAATVASVEILNEVNTLAWYFQMLAINYTMYLYYETDSENEDETYVPVSFSLEAEDSSSGEKTMYEDFYLYDAGYISRKDAEYRLGRVNAIRTMYCRYREEKANPLLQHVIKVDVRYDENNQMLPLRPDLLFSQKKIDYNLQFAERCNKTIYEEFNVNEKA